MSFILDALKKSEGQRQRQSGPALFEVKVAPPRTRIPPWAAAVGALLLVNLLVLGWFALRPAATHAVVQSQPAPSVTAAPPAAASALIEQRSPAPPSSAPVEEDFEPELIADERYDVRPAEDEPASMPYESAAEPPPSDASRVTRGTVLGVPTYEQLLGGSGPALPQLRLDLHVFANDPAARFIFLNNARLGEGDALPDGTRVESIVPDGAVLSVRGTRFLLQRQ